MVIGLWPTSHMVICLWQARIETPTVSNAFSNQMSSLKHLARFFNEYRDIYVCGEVMSTNLTDILLMSLVSYLRKRYFCTHRHRTQIEVDLENRHPR